MPHSLCAHGPLWLCLFSVVGCSGADYAPGRSPDAGDTYAAIVDEPAGPVEVAQLPGNAETDSATVEPVERKIIYNATLDLTVEDFAEIPAQVEKLVAEHDGFIAHSNLRTASGSPRSGEWRIRVPVNRYSEFLNSAESLAELQSRSEDSQEVTAEYYDLQIRIRNKQREEDRLLEHLETSTGKLEEILKVETEVARVRTEVEQLQGRLRMLQDQTSLSTVTLRIHELSGYVPEESPTFGTRISRAWSQSIGALLETGQAFVIVVVALAPWLLLLAIPASILFFLIRHALRRSQAKTF
ncbi:MAG: DUF4349 domain-containing protein [Planctomycetota bacterium]|nr:MAG: DUF4349 domain-containing protein [Planctomycetota bacterium]REJ89455.1 MAG: DUF4349 domain-containing protein [Planctomycetota bacterium]REK28974.1 MAG: DUF4349 domain-containing protein [Planctomycetota bacterium]REK39592.1 MAG: DUF4349 domain-containing protein [Planctomycetota bacterium]